MSNTALGAALTIDDSVLAKIQEAENRIIRLEQTTRTSADKIAKSFRSMGDLGVQYFIDKLKIAQIELTKLGGVNVSSSANAFGSLSSNVTAAAVAMNQFGDRIFNTKKNLAELIEERKTLTKELTKGEGIPLKDQQKWVNALEDVNRQIKEQMKGVQKLADEYEKAQERIIKANKKTYAEQAKLYQQQNLKQNTTYQGALSFAENANTINRRTKAIQYLTQARAQLSTTDANYTQKLKALNDAIKRMNAENERAVQGARNLAQQHSNLMNTSDQLSRKLALIFSVSQIQGYVNKLIQVRGEFELQNTALASILQNKDQADKLFGQITELAVQSPFTVKELTTYTKSLAAYQFQYEELYDTTKRLADVASGLGVDMQRLILAVGQVKAAGYLRGTETRQFTEAGFNILGELAKYYSELEGRIVSIGEVQERQFKRMIAFQDVEEVFRRVTDAGGMFYQMQEKQAETLAGQMSNLKDSIDLMLNSIGKANEGTIKDMVAMVRSIVENWRDVETAMNALLTMFSPYLAYMALAKVASSKFALNLLNIATNSTKVTKALDVVSNKVTALSTKMNLGAKGAKVMTTALGGLATLGIGAAISGLIAGMTYMYVEMTKASREAENLKNSLTNIASEGFVRSAELSRTFETLANKAVEAADGSKEQQAALEELKRTYRDILPERQLEIESLRELKGEYESVTTAIYSKIQADIKEKQIQEVGNTYGKDFADSLDALAKKLSNYNISLEKARAIVGEFRKEVEKGTISTSTTARKYLEELIARATEAKVTLTEKGFVDTAGGKTWGDVVIEEIDDVLGAYTKFYVEIDKITGQPVEFFNVKATPLYSELKSQFEDIVKFKEQWDKENKDKFSLKVEFNEASKNALISQYQKFIQDIQSQMSSGKIQPKDFVSANLIIEEAQKAIEKLDVSPQIAQVNDLRVEFSKLYDIDFEKFSFTKMLEGQGFNDFLKQLDAGIKGYKDALKEFRDATEQGLEMPFMQKQYLEQNYGTEDYLNKLIPALENYRKSIALTTKEESKSGRDTTSQVFKDRLSFFERANKEYEKLLQNYSAEEARAKVISSMMDEAQQRGVGGIFMSAEFDDKGTLDSLNRVKSMYSKLSQDMRIEFAKAFGGIQLDMDIEVRQDRVKAIQDQFSNLFGNYELSLELDKLGLDKDLMSQLFGVEVFDLSQLRKVLEPFKNELQNTLGKEGVSAWDEINKKISEAEEKELQDRLKTYSQYLKKSVSERVAIEMEAQKKIAEVRATEEFTPEQQERIVTQIKQETQVKKDEQAWKGFQDSELYIKMFEDLEFASTKALDAMEQKLIDVRSSLKTLSPTELKQINDQLEKIREVKISRNPFEGLQNNIKGYIEYLKKADELNSKFIESQEKETGLKEQYDMQLLINQETQKQYANLVKNNQENSSEGLILKKKLNQQDKILDVTLKQLVAQRKITQEFAKQIRAGEQLGSNAQNQINNIGSNGSQVVSSISEFTGMLSNWGIEFSDEFGGVLSGIGQAFDGLNKIDITKPMSIVSGAISIVSGIGNAFASIFGAGNKDKKKEKEIQRQIEQVEKLQKAYEKLEEAIDSAYSIDTLERSTDQAIANLQKQNQSLQNAIAAEESKKKTDYDRIKEWQDAIKSNNEAIEQLVKDQISTVTAGILDDGLSAADAFVDAWLEAFQETGDGLQGLEDNFNDMLLNMIKRQAAMSLVSPLIKKMQKELKKYINAEDTELTISEAERYAQYIKEQLPEVSAALENLFNGLKDVGLEFGGGDTMSELSRGISSITEETAQALEALLNSMRYFASDSNLQLRTILATLTAPAPENPFLLELKAQTEQLRTMNSLWNSLSKMSTGNGRVLKVQIV